MAAVRQVGPCVRTEMCIMCEHLPPAPQVTPITVASLKQFLSVACEPDPLFSILTLNMLSHCSGKCTHICTQVSISIP